jgi:hypothetical protein
MALKHRQIETRSRRVRERERERGEELVRLTISIAAAEGVPVEGQRQ